MRATPMGRLVLLAAIGSSSAFIGLAYYSYRLDRQADQQDAKAEAQAMVGRLVSTAGQIAFLDAHSDAVNLINADGTARRRVPVSGQASFLTWSPDGARLAIQGNDRISLLTPDGSAPTPLTSGAAPAWAPDGGHLAFAAGPHVAIIQADGAGLHALEATNLFKEHNGSYTHSSPALIRWSPDGTRLAFAYRYYHWGGHGNFYDAVALVKADGSDLKLVPLPATAQRPEVTTLYWSADGIFLRCLCRCDEGYPEQVTVYVLDTGLPEAQSIGSVRAHWDREAPPAWSPDGQSLAYESPYRNDGKLTILHLATGQVQELVRGVRPEWSPDGTRLTFVRPVSNTLAVMNADGSGLTVLLTNTDNYAIRQLAWRPGRPHGGF